MISKTINSDESNLPDHYVAAKRIDSKDYNEKTLKEFIEQYCIKEGKPLVVSNIHCSPGWKSEIFTLDQLKEYRGDSEVELTFQKKERRRVVLGEFIERVQKETKMESNHSYKPYIKKTDKVYAKDIICPVEYREAMNDFLPDYLLPHGTDDLFSILPERFRAENLMCYLGQNGTGTPIHRDLCGTMGHNVMTMASPGGFAEWMIIENQQRDELAAVLEPSKAEKRITSRPEKRVQKSDSSSDTKSSFMESDRAWLNTTQIKKKPIKPQVIIQRPGDMVIIPSRAYHQVRNKGVSVKIAWNRITPQTLAYAFEDQLPLYQIISRPEVYKCKAIVALTIDKWNAQLQEIDIATDKSSVELYKQRDLATECGRSSFLKNAETLANIFLHSVLEPEMLYNNEDKDIITDAEDEVFTVRCDFCYGDIFYRYYHCDLCDSYDLCLNCYAIGRSCPHVTGMTMYQGPKSIQHFIDLYRSFVRNTNKLLGDKIEPNLESSLMNINSHEASNLASTCRRIEKYRKLTNEQCNVLRCSHCSKTTTVSEVSECGISLASIFRRGLCKSLDQKANDKTALDVYVCVQCTEKCPSCYPLESTLGSLQDYDLVYYFHPSHDKRNWGGFIDFNITKTCDYPFTEKGLKRKASNAAASTKTKKATANKATAKKATAKKATAKKATAKKATAKAATKKTATKKTTTQKPAKKKAITQQPDKKKTGETRKAIHPTDSFGNVLTRNLRCSRKAVESITEQQEDTAE